MSTLEIFCRLLAATMVGGLLGSTAILAADRRTLGSRRSWLALAVLAGNQVGGVGDTSRVIQGIVTGIGFLGAGVIVRAGAGFHVQGLTTAACTWLTACFGVTCAVGDWTIVAMRGGACVRRSGRRRPDRKNAAAQVARCGRAARRQKPPDRFFLRNRQEAGMTMVREPILTPVTITDLRPTQITVGMREVKDKRLQLRKRKSQKIGKFLGDHMIPVILGPRGLHYVIDHHHLSLALHSEGIKHVLVTVIADLSALDDEAFWVVLDHRGLDASL